MHSLLFSTIHDNDIALIAILGSFAIPVLIVGTVFYFRHRREQLWHETARLALEKGQPVPSYAPTSEGDTIMPPVSGPPPAEWQRWQNERRRWKDLRGGLVVLAVGAAMGFSSGRDGMFFVPSFVPLVLIGVGCALILGALLPLLFRGKHDDSGSQPPKA